MSTVELIRLNDVCNLTTLKRSTIFKAIRQNTMPQPIKLLGKINAWNKQEIIDWINDQRKIK